MAKLFISYSSRDSLVADHVYAALVASGHEVWMDREAIKGGEDWLQAIQENLLRAETLVVLWSANALQSEWVQDEIAFARSKRKQIIPVRIDDTDPSENMIINARQIIDARGRDFNEVILKINIALQHSTRLPPHQASASRFNLRWSGAIAIVVVGAAIFVLVRSIIPVNPPTTPTVTPRLPTITATVNLQNPVTQTSIVTPVPEPATMDSLNTWRQANGYEPLRENPILDDVASTQMTYLSALPLSDLDVTNLYLNENGRDAQWMVENAGYTGSAQMFVIAAPDDFRLPDLLAKLEREGGIDVHMRYREIGLASMRGAVTSYLYFVLILGTGA